MLKIFFYSHHTNKPLVPTTNGSLSLQILWQMENCYFDWKFHFVQWYFGQSHHSPSKIYIPRGINSFLHYFVICVKLLANKSFYFYQKYSFIYTIPISQWHQPLMVPYHHKYCDRWKTVILIENIILCIGILGKVAIFLVKYTFHMA